jgi:uncharacterized OB-fold protein
MQLPQPRADADSAHYWAEAARGRLVLRACNGCGKRHFPPRHTCPVCWSHELTWIEAAGEATVYSFTIMRRAPDPAWQARVPYVVALVDLPEGVRMMTNIVGDDAPGVEIGERVEVCFEARGEARVPQFRRRPQP